jgi:hypothetical protein
VGGDAGERQLIRPEPEQRARGRVRGGVDEAVDERVTRPPHPGRAVDEVGGEPAVGVGELRTIERGREREVGERTLRLDPAQHVERQGAS